MPEKRKRGGQTKYRPEYCKKLIEYFDRPATREQVKEVYYPSGEVKIREVMDVAEDMPTFSGFAKSIKVYRQTLYDWAEEHPDFAVAMETARTMQEDIWLINAMSGRYNAQFAQFFGKNCLGYKDKTEVEHDQAKPFEVNIKVE